jgi:hypothetical protein
VSDRLSTAALSEALTEHRRLGEASGDAVTDPIGRMVTMETPMLLKRDHRALITAVAAGTGTVVIKAVRKGGVARRMADMLRGSPARRGFWGARGLEIRGVPVAAPLAYLERRVLGVPLASYLVTEDLRDAVPVFELNFESDAAQGSTRDLAVASGRHARDALGGVSIDAILSTLADLLATLHAKRIRHGDLQALHLYLRRSGERIEAVLIDNEDVRFEKVLDDAARIHDLAVLNASIADAVATPAQRLSALDRYLAKASMVCSRDEVVRRIVAESLARGHAWRGDDCCD